MAGCLDRVQLAFLRSSRIAFRQYIRFVTDYLSGFNLALTILLAFGRYLYFMFTSDFSLIFLLVLRLEGDQYIWIHGVAIVFTCYLSGTLRLQCFVLVQLLCSVGPKSGALLAGRSDKAFRYEGVDPGP